MDHLKEPYYAGMLTAAEHYAVQLINALRLYRFSCNMLDRISSTTVEINASISYFKAPAGAYIRAEAREESKFIDDLVQDTIADEDELQQAVSNNAD